MAPVLNTAVVLSMVAGGLAATLPEMTQKGVMIKPSKRVLVGAARPTLPAVRARAAGAGSASASSGAGPAPGPEYLTISIVNSHSHAISTVHHSDPSGPAPTDLGQVKPGTIAAGTSATFAVPTGWIGNIAVVDAQYNITNSDTLVEANYVIPQGYNHAVADVDISYVNGFSIAMTCSCSGKVVSGCNKDLSKLGKCPDQDSESACVNPLRADEQATEAAPFFTPCQHAAWAYVNDGKADAWGSCQSGQIVCCAGTACPANPRQAADPDNGNNNNNNGTVAQPSGKEDDGQVVAAASGTVISLPGIPSLSLPALPASFSLPVVASFSRPAFASSLGLPLTLNPSATFPAVPALSLSLPAGVSVPTALQPAPTTAAQPGATTPASI